MRPVLRTAVSVLLVVLLGLEILPWGVVESVPANSGEQRERTLRIEPLQVCDHGDFFLGALFDLPVLLPGAFCLFTPTEFQPLDQLAVPLVQDGFHPAIDRPPRLSA